MYPRPSPRYAPLPPPPPTSPPLPSARGTFREPLVRRGKLSQDLAPAARRLTKEVSRKKDVKKQPYSFEDYISGGIEIYYIASYNRIRSSGKSAHVKRAAYGIVEIDPENWKFREALQKLCDTKEADEREAKRRAKKEGMGVIPVEELILRVHHKHIAKDEKTWSKWLKKNRLQGVECSGEHRCTVNLSNRVSWYLYCLRIDRETRKQAAKETGRQPKLIKERGEDEHEHVTNSDLDDEYECVSNDDLDDQNEFYDYIEPPPRRQSPQIRQEYQIEILSRSDEDLATPHDDWYKDEDDVAANMSYLVRVDYDARAISDERKTPFVPSDPSYGFYHVRSMEKDLVVALKQVEGIHIGEHPLDPSYVQHVSAQPRTAYAVWNAERGCTQRVYELVEWQLKTEEVRALAYGN